MGTGQEMGTSLQKGVKKFVNGYRAKNGNVLQKGVKKFVNGYRVKEIRQWIQSEK